MSVRDAVTVARHDFLNARRSKLVWGVVAIYVAFLLLVFYAGSLADQPDVTQALYTQVALTTLLLPLVAVAAAYLAVAGERESNTVRFLMSQPLSRGAVVTGKLLSRSVLLVVALALAVLAGVGLVAATYPALEAGQLATFFGLTLLLVGAYVSVSVAISAASATRSRAIGGAIGFYFVSDVLFLFGDFSVIGLVRYVLEDLLGGDYHQYFYEALRSLSPANAYLNSTQIIFEGEGVGQIPRDLPYYLQEQAMVAVLVAWIVLPAVLGVIAFRRAELG